MFAMRSRAEIANRSLGSYNTDFLLGLAELER